MAAAYTFLDDMLRMEFSKDAVDSQVLDGVLSACAPIGRKGMKFPEKFIVTAYPACMVFVFPEEGDAEVMEMTDEDSGYYATRAYFCLLHSQKATSDAINRLCRRLKEIEAAVADK